MTFNRFTKDDIKGLRINVFFSLPYAPFLFQKSFFQLIRMTTQEDDFLHCFQKMADMSIKKNKSIRGKVPLNHFIQLDQINKLGAPFLIQSSDAVILLGIGMQMNNAVALVLQNRRNRGFSGSWGAGKRSGM